MRPSPRVLATVLTTLLSAVPASSAAVTFELAFARSEVFVGPGTTLTMPLVLRESRTGGVASLLPAEWRNSPLG